MLRKSRFSCSFFLSLLLLLALFLTACNGTISAKTTSTSSSHSSTTSNADINPLPKAQQTLKLFVEPDAGESVILNAINNAHHAILLEMYLLTDTSIIQALENAAHRKISISVMLEPTPYGGGSPDDVLTELKAAGIAVKTTSPDYSLTHEKGMVIDGNTAYIMSCNYTYSALNGSNREYGVIDTIAQDVQEVTDIFNADWNRKLPHLTDSTLVVSPVNSRSDLTNLINGAKKTLILEQEEMYDDSIEQVLVNAAKRGVLVQVILPTPYQGESDDNSDGMALLKRGGVLVREDAQLYIHAKMFVADGTNGFIGSENVSASSLDGNRELGILLTDKGILSTLEATFASDWRISK